METCSSKFRLFEKSSPSNSGNAISDEDTYATVATSRPKKRAGRIKFRETRHPLYRGVRQRNGGKWVCEMREPYKKSRIWLGTFPTPEMAARAHDVAAMALRGRSACLNFADSAWLLPVPPSAAIKDIQKTAAEAAEAFRPLNSRTGVSLESPTVSSPPECVFYLDEEALFDMPGFLASMAEGMLLSPPPGVVSRHYWDDVELGADVSLWSYSI